MARAKALETTSKKRKSKKYHLVVDTARKIFLEQGYDRASMDLIATEAGVSKATLYVYFENKEALLGALILEECKHVGPEVLGDGPQQMDNIEAALLTIARNFIRLFLIENSLGVYQLIMANAAHFPDIAEIFMEAGPRKLQAEIADFFQSAVNRGLLKIDNIDLAVKQFFSLVQGDLPIHCALSMKRPEKMEYDVLIEGGVRVFLAAYGTQDKR